jgi:hypothetical protein
MKYAIFIISDYWADDEPGQLAGPFDTPEEAIEWHKATAPLESGDYKDLVRELTEPGDWQTVPLDDSGPGELPTGLSAEQAADFMRERLEDDDS